jgi:acetyl-CoA synthetase
MNIYDSCINGPHNQAAIVYQNESGKISKQTYGELDIECSRVARGLNEIGLRKGDAVAVDMVMTIESVAIYLGILKAGCVAVSIADSLAPNEIQKRLMISKAKVVFTQDVIIRGSKKLPLYEKVLEAKPERVIVLPIQGNLQATIREQDILWDDFLFEYNEFSSVVCDPMDSINILFSSGTTGEPKAIPWNHTTPIKCASDGFLHHDIKQGDVVCWPTNLGWMMGPWLIFATLINKGTIALCYAPPTGIEFIEFVRDVKVSMLGVVPSIVKQWRLRGLLNDIDWSAIKNFSSTGESSNEEDMLWMMSKAGYKPVIEYCGGTEIGGGYITGTMVQPAAPACFTTPALGLDILMLDENGIKSNKGEVFIIPPSIGLSVSLLNKDHYEEYFQDTPKCEGAIQGCSGLSMEEQSVFSGNVFLRRHGDEIEQINADFYRAHGRVDDTMNLGGIKVSSVEIESTLNQLDGIKETAAIGISSLGGPSELVLYIVLEEGHTATTEELIKLMQLAIKNKLNPLFKIKEAHLTNSLPRTASNKVMRRALRNQYLSRN